MASRLTRVYSPFLRKIMRKAGQLCCSPHRISPILLLPTTYMQRYGLSLFLGVFEEVEHDHWVCAVICQSWLNVILYWRIIWVHHDYAVLYEWVYWGCLLNYDGRPPLSLWQWLAIRFARLEFPYLFGVHSLESDRPPPYTGLVVENEEIRWL